MPKVSREYQEMRQNQIIEAAIECFSEKGFHQTSMQDIVDKSDLSPGAIYLYFKSKDEIIKTIADIRHAHEIKIITDAFDRGDTSVALSELTEIFFTSLLDKDILKQRNIGIQLWGEALTNPNVYKIAKQGIDEPKNVLTEILTEYQNKGKLDKDLSPEAVARVMLAQFQGFVLQITMDNELNVEEYIKVVKCLIDKPLLEGKYKG
jgi:AcrR family transcriptional regulator